MHAPTLFYYAHRLPATRSPYRCRKDSTTRRARYAPMTRQEAARLYQQAEHMECATRQPGKQDGAIGRNGLAVLRAFLFGFLNRKTGQLDPGHAAIARRAGISERSVRRGLAKLKAAGLVHWLRRCVEVAEKGAFLLKQITNAYAVLPASQWLGFSVLCPERPPAPPPAPGTWGDHPPLPDALTAARAEYQQGCGIRTVLATLQADPQDELALALARFGSAMVAQKGGYDF